jgi:hypothetical protein
VRAAVEQGVKDPDRIAQHVRERINEGLRERVTDALRERMRTELRDEVANAVRNFAQEMPALFSNGTTTATS